MKTMKNRVLSGAMAGVLAMSLAVPAFAADDHTTVVTGKYQDTPIAVTVPETGKAFINPYGLNIEVPVPAEVSLTAAVIAFLAIVAGRKENARVASKLSSSVQAVLGVATQSPVKRNKAILPAL